MSETIYQKRLLNTKEAAKYLKLKTQTLYNWRNQRKGPSYIMCGGPKYELSELDRFIDANRVKLGV